MKQSGAVLDRVRFVGLANQRIARDAAGKGGGSHQHSHDANQTLGQQPSSLRLPGGFDTHVTRPLHRPGDTPTANLDRDG
jgi:hypothetical protein